MFYTRLLKFKFPLIRGEDVLEVQKVLNSKGARAGEPDGVFGPATENAVRRFQAQAGLRPDGLVGPLTWNKLFEAVPQSAAFNPQNQFEQRLKDVVEKLQEPNRFRDVSISWQLYKEGIGLEGNAPVGTPGEPATVTRVWNSLRSDLVKWSEHYGVPVELIMSTICTESSGRLDIPAREEPGYISDEQTPHRVSPGIMQTLISTAREALGKEDIDRAWLQVPGNSIQAGTAYIAKQWKVTHFNPPKVACAYNAGGVYFNDSPNNPWKMRQYPIGSGEHANRFVEWFNDFFKVLKVEGELPRMSFYRALAG